MNVFIYREGEVIGPFSRFTVFAGLRDGTFSSEDTACVEGSEEWKPLQLLLTGKLGVGKEFTPASPTPEPADSLESGAAKTTPESAPIGFLPQKIDSTPKVILGPKPSQGRLRHLASYARDLAATCTSFALLFIVVALLTFVIGRSRFLRTTNIVTIETNQTQSQREAKPVPNGTVRSAPDQPLVKASHPASTEVSETASNFVDPVGPGPSDDSRNLVIANLRAPTVGAGSTAYDTRGSEQASKGGRKTGREKRLFDTPRIAPRELLDVLAERFAATPVNTAGTTTKPDPNLSIREGSFLLDTGLAWNPQVEVVYSIPLYKNSTVGPRAANVLMWSDWPAAMAPPKETMIDGKLVRERSHHFDHLSYYSRELGYTAFSMHFVTRTWDNPEETYFLGGKQWVDLVFRAQAELTRMFKLPPRNLMLTGVSIGAAFAERIAAAKPDKVAAVALLSAPEITLPKQVSNTLWYLQINRGDSMQGEYTKLYNTLQGQNAKVLFDIFPPDYAARGRSANMYHTVSALDTEATRSFLDGVVTRRDAAGNVDPAAWPFVRDQDRPYIILSKNSPNLDRIAPDKREFLPSERMVRCLQSLPVPVHALVLPQGNGKETKCYVGLPPLGRPRGVVIYAPEASYKGITDMFNDVYFLAEKGYLVLCPYTMQAGSKTLSTTLKFVQDTPLFKKYPVVLVGVGERANQLWREVAQSGLDPSAMVLLRFKPHHLLDESELTAESHPIRFPVLFVQDEAQLLNASTTAEVKEHLTDARKIDAYIAQCRERHQISRVILIPANDNSEERNAQKTVQAINDSFADLVEGHRGTIIK